MTEYIDKDDEGCVCAFLRSIPLAMTLWWVISMTGAIMIGLAFSALKGNIGTVDLQEVVLGPYFYAIVAVAGLDLLILLSAVLTTGKTRDNCCARDNCSKSCCLSLMNVLFCLTFLTTVGLIALFGITVFYYPIGSAASATQQTNVADHILRRIQNDLDPNLVHPNEGQKALQTFFAGADLPIDKADDAVAAQHNGVKALAKIINDAVAAEVVDHLHTGEGEVDTAQHMLVDKMEELYDDHKLLLLLLGSAMMLFAHICILFTLRGNTMAADHTKKTYDVENVDY